MLLRRFRPLCSKRWRDRALCMTVEEATILWPKIKRFKHENGREPSPSSPDASERRYAECLAFTARVVDACEPDRISQYRIDATSARLVPKSRRYADGGRGDGGGA